MLKRLNLPTDIKRLSLADLSVLAKEVRERIISVSLQNGGHIGASLGAVELIVALLKVFDPDRDKIVFDVGHQAYAYKILTGRNTDFDRLRAYGGISGFPKPSESKYDHFVGGHAGNAVSACCGYAMARKLSGEDHEVISVVGDGVMVNGETAEGLNLVASTGKQIIVINDNTYSISAGVGSIPEYLEKLRGKAYAGRILRGAESPFSQYELDYLGPIDGHDISMLTEAFALAKESKDPVIVHVVTNKGKGYAPAELNPLKLHGVSPRGEGDHVSFGPTIGKTLARLREKDPRIVAVAAAMAIGTGLTHFESRFPESFIDVGIAESTAITVAASLARAGYKPYVGIYSTFLQRAYDQLLYDVSLDGLDVTLLVDRAGIVGEDGESHQGIYDLNLLSAIPNVTIMAPSSYQELEAMLEWSVERAGVKVIRYPKGNADTGIPTDGNFPFWRVLRRGDGDVLIAHGPRMVENALAAAEILKAKGRDITVVNARYISPVDLSFLNVYKDKKLFVAEDVVFSGSLSEKLMTMDYDVTPITLPNTYVTFGKVCELQKEYGLDAVSIAEKILL